MWRIHKAPVLNSIELSDETVNAGGTLTVTIDAEDDLTGVADWQATFVNKETKKHLTTYLQKYSDAGMLETSKYEPSGTYELESVSLEDKAGNIVFYEKNPGGWEPGDNAIIKKLELEVSFTVTNDNQVDTQAPELKDVKVDKDSVKAGETLEVTIGAEDDLTGVADWQATFVNKETKKHLTTYLQKYSDAGMLKTSKYEPSGTYELESVSLEDKAGNIVFYEKNPGGWEPGDNAIIKKLELEVSFTVTNDNQVDTQAPELKDVKVDKDSVKAGETLEVTIGAEDDLTGVADWQATFVNKETKKHLTTYLQKYSDAGMLKTSKYEPSGTYELESVLLEDKAGNRRRYEAEPDEGYTGRAAKFFKNSPSSTMTL